MSLNSERLILLPPVDSKSNYLDGFWRWVEMLAKDDYQGAFEGLYWQRLRTLEIPVPTPEGLKKTITTFFGGNAPWSVVVPNDRLISFINDAAEYEPLNESGHGWLMAMVPLTTEPADPKNDEIPLTGLATSFYVRQHQEHYVLEFEIFHV